MGEKTFLESISPVCLFRCKRIMCMDGFLDYQNLLLAALYSKPAWARVSIIYCLLTCRSSHSSSSEGQMSRSFMLITLNSIIGSFGSSIIVLLSLDVQSQRFSFIYILIGLRYFEVSECTVCFSFCKNPLSGSESLSSG